MIRPPTWPSGTPGGKESRPSAAEPALNDRQKIRNIERELSHFIETVSGDLDLDVDAEFESLVAPGGENIAQENLRPLIDAFGVTMLQILDLPPMPGTLEIIVSDDHRRAMVKIDPPLQGGEPVSDAKIRSELARLGVVHGIDDAEIARAAQLAVNQSVRGVCVARAADARPGQPGRLEKLGGMDATQTVAPDAASFIPVAMMDLVIKDQVIARYVPPTPGRAGTDILGVSIPAEDGAPMEIEIGPNVRCDESNATFYATSPGRLAMSGGAITVQNILEVDGDLDIATGHTRFDGELLVHGDIRSDLSVIVDGDIAVRGGVEAAKVSSIGGSIIIQQGIRGGGCGVVQSYYDVHAKFIEQGTVLAGGCVEAESILHSEIAAGEAVRVVTGKGAIIGGQIFGGQELDVKILGSPSGTTTRVDVGIKPAELARLTDLKKKLADAEKTRQEAEASLKQMGICVESVLGAAESPSNRQFVKLAKLIVVLAEKCRKIRKQEESFLKTISRKTEGVVRVRDCVYPGVVIRIGPAVYHVCDELSRAQFRYDKSSKRVEVGAL